MAKRKVYIPADDEIKRRCEILRWMQLFSWDWEVIDSIMYHDNPTPETVVNMTYRWGPHVAYGILRKIILDD